MMYRWSRQAGSVRPSIRSTLVLACALSFGWAGALHAQADTAAVPATSGEARARLRAPDQVLLATTGSFRTSPSGWLGRTPDREVFITAVRGTWRLSNGSSARVGYFAELIPAAVVTRNVTNAMPMHDCVKLFPEWKSRLTVPVIEYFESCKVESASAYGVGVTPVGVSARISRDGGMALVTEISVGGILFDKSMPYPNTTRFNYNVAAGTSVELPMRGRSVLTFGYHIHHLSNGGRADFNPGIAAHALRIGWGWGRGGS